MSTVIEIKPREYVIRTAGHQLKQHYFTLASAEQAARTLK